MLAAGLRCRLLLYESENSFKRFWKEYGTSYLGMGLTTALGGPTSRSPPALDWRVVWSVVPSAYALIATVPSA